MAKLTLNDITSGYASVDTLNSNFTAIETALENTLSRDGTTPNSMSADLDMNGNLLLNSGNAVQVSGFTWEGAWTTRGYSVGDIVEYNGTAYMCIVAHTAVVFATELAEAKWQLFATAATPTQAGNNGRLLSTDGATLSWVNPTSSVLKHTSSKTGAVERTILSKLDDYNSVKDFGAVGDGVTADQVAVALANTNATIVWYPAGTYRISSNTTLTKTIVMQPGARFKVDGGATLTINAPVYAGSREYIFEGASGAVAGTFGNVELWVDWFGATPDGSVVLGTGTDSGPAINRALLAATNTGTKYGAVRFNPGNYLLGTGVVSSHAGISIKGAGKYVTILTTPNAFSGAAVTLGGPGGPPSTFSGFGVVAQVGGSFSANGINVTGNGTFVEDVWISGYSAGIKLSNTDQHLMDFISEQSVVGVFIDSSYVTVSDGLVHYNQQIGVYGENVDAIDGGAILVDNVRATADGLYGFRFVNVDNLTISGCSVSHNNAGQYLTAGYSIEGSSRQVTIEGCSAYLGTVSPSSTGYALSSVQTHVYNCTARNFYVGIKADQPYNYSVQNCFIVDSKLHGIQATDYNFLSVTGNQCLYSGTAAVSDAGISVTANRAYQRLLVSNNQCNATGGGTQDYGVRVTCTNALSYGLVTTNIASFNNTGNITIDGANAANITSANNITT